MNILLVNDDGYDAPGIQIMKKLLSKYGRVVLLAPDGPRSAQSAALTIGRGLKVEKISEDTFKCDGTPVDCASFGLCSLNIKFDLVVSGCNNGYNVSYDTMYSGTVAAALESLIFGVPSIAVSAPYGSDFKAVEEHFDEVWAFIQKKKLLSDKYLLNINFPKDEVKGIELGSLYYRKDQNYFTKEEDGYYAYRYMQEDFSDQKDSDCYLYRHGVISIVPLSRTYFNPEILKQLKNK